MKVLIRMLASILPGVIVGLGVIAYLEREHLQEEWSSLFGAHEVAGEDRHDEASHQISAVVDPFNYQEKVESPVAEVTESKQPVPEVVAQPKAKERIAATTIYPQSKSVVEARSESEPVVEVAEVAQPVETSAPPVAEERTVEEKVASPAPVLSEVLGLKEQPMARHPETVEPSLPMAILEATDDLPQLPADQIALMARPMEDLAATFNPLPAPQQDPYGVAAEKQRNDIWHIDPLDEAMDANWLWNRGRQAFWEGDYESAIESYRSLLQEEPMNPDAWGELGNIYYAKKDWARAVRAFGRAAAVLIQTNRVDEAEKILTVVRGIDPALATQLAAELAQ